MGWLQRQGERVQHSFKKIWASDYPRWLWFVNAGVGVLAGTLFAVLGFDGTTGEKAGVGIGVAVCAGLIFFGFTYGVVRARGPWGPNRPADRGFGGR